MTTMGDWNGSTVSTGTTFSSTTLATRWPSTGVVSGSGPGLVTMVPNAVTMIGKAWPGRILLGTNPCQEKVQTWRGGLTVTVGPLSPNWICTRLTAPLICPMEPDTCRLRP